MKKILLIFSLLLLSCGARMSISDKETIEENSPELNKISSADVGVTLVYKEKGLIYKALISNEDRTVKPGNFAKEIHSGEIFLNKYSTKEYDLYESPLSSSYGIAIAKNGGSEVFYVDYGNGAQIVKIKRPISCTKTTVPFKERDYFRQEFIYNGKIGTGLKFTYREFLDSTARPAYTQDIQYDMAESNSIGFRDLRIEILNATNTNIQYKVISHF